MSNVRRLGRTDRIFFVTVNLHQTVPNLGESEFPLVIAALEESRRRLGFLLCGYVLMPDHWHALVSTRYPLTISRVIQDVKYVSARKINRRRKTRGCVWQHQFWERFVRHAKEFEERIEYMHVNPVRRGLVARAEGWPWSSYHNFNLQESRVPRCPIRIDYVRLPEEYRG